MKFLLFSLLMIAQCSIQSYPRKEIKLTESEAKLAAQLHDITKQYLDEHLTFFSKGGKPFSRFEVLGVDETDGIIHEYVWSYFSEYAVRDGHLVIGSGGSLPVALYIRRDGTEFKVEGHKASEFGGLDMFPEKLQSILKEYVPPKEWEAQIKEDAAKYYNLY